MAEMYRHLQAGYSAPFEAAIERGFVRGELTKGPTSWRRWRR